MNIQTSSNAEKKARIAIIGLGYVGLPLAIEFGKKFDVLGFDINIERVKELQLGKDRTQEANLEGLREAIELKTKSQMGLWFSSHKEDLKAYDTYIVTVP